MGKHGSIAGLLGMFLASPGLAMAEPDEFCYAILPGGGYRSLTVLCQKGTDDRDMTKPDPKTPIWISELNYSEGRGNGRIINRTGKSIRFLKLYYETLAEDGSLVDSGYVYTTPYDLTPGQRATFAIATTRRGTLLRITRQEWKEAR